MYGSYAHADDGEDESVSGSFNIASLVDSNKKYKRRMGQSDCGGATRDRPVRMNFTGPVRLPQNKPFAREDNHEVEAENKYKHNMVERVQDKENLPHQPTEQGGARPKQFSACQPTNSTSTTERKYVCKECGKGFIYKYALQQHGTVHTKVKPFVCDVVGCSYPGCLNLDKKSLHEGVIHECQECGERFSVKGAKTRHNKTVHLQVKPYQCAECSLRYVSNHALQTHIKTVHEKIKAFKCEQCNKRFATASNMNRHIGSVHSLIRYPCTWGQGCSATRSTKYQVKVHIRQVHTLGMPSFPEDPPQQTNDEMSSPPASPTTSMLSMLGRARDELPCSVFNRGNEGCDVRSQKAGDGGEG